VSQPASCPPARHAVQLRAQTRVPHSRTGLFNPASSTACSRFTLLCCVSSLAGE
jgi:hypothetical protein